MKINTKTLLITITISLLITLSIQKESKNTSNLSKSKQDIDTNNLPHLVSALTPANKNLDEYHEINVKKSGVDSVGTTSSYEKKAVEALAYDDSYKKDAEEKTFGGNVNMVVAKYVTKLEKGHQFEEDKKSDKDKIVAETTNTASDMKNNYYDGIKALRAGRENCDEFSSDPDTCLKNSHCGWCEDSRKCIPGTKLGPLRKCKRSSFKYFKPRGEWKAEVNYQ